MDNSLIARFQRAELERFSARRRYADLKHRLSVAKADVEHFHDLAVMAGTKVGFIERVCEGMWLELMNSGISHRRLLKLVREIERG